MGNPGSPGTQIHVDEDWFSIVMAIGDFDRQCAYLNQNFKYFNEEEVARQLKEQADQLLRADLQRSLQICQLLLHLADLTGNPRTRALGLLAEANARGIGLGEYESAIRLYNQAAAIYTENGWMVERAVAQIGKIGALTFLGRYAEALECGEWASEVLEAAEKWFSLAVTSNNLAIVHYHLGDDYQALSAFERAQELYEKAGQADCSGWLMAEFNRAIVLRNLGEFEASIQSSQLAYQKLKALSQPVEAARALQNLALTYFVLGRYNESLEIFDQVRETFLADGRSRDASLVELFICDCLIQLRRFPDVIEKCRQVRLVFDQLGTRFEVGLAILDEAVAYSGLKRYKEALASLDEAEQLFKGLGNRAWIFAAKLEAASVSLEQGQAEQAFRIAQECIQGFESQPVKRALACLIAARAALFLNRPNEVRYLLEQAIQVGEEHHVLTLTYAAHSLLGKLAENTGDRLQALAEYDRTIQDVELLRGRLMIEFRADFLEDKQSFYEDLVSLCIELEQPSRALEYAERSKSRALLDLIACRLDVRLSAIDPADQPLADELVRLQREHDRLCRRWESTVREELHYRGSQLLDQKHGQAQVEVMAIEKHITETWHKLLIRNAGYARDASLWQVRAEPVQPYLEPGTLLLEYYFARDQLFLFLITHDSLQAICLPAGQNEVRHLLEMLWLNWRAVASQAPEQQSALLRNARGLLGRLYDLLISPALEAMSNASHLIIVPHSALHYLPFHALFDGQDYLIDRHEISYLPAASFLRYCSEARPTGSDFLIAGNSQAGNLTYTVQEAQSIAHLWGRPALLEDEATIARIQSAAPSCRLLHLAAHGSFRADNPLFSGLSLADGWLTTLDIFNLRLNASLVTLSACETGRSVVSGGDELLGLMRAFLYAGAASLVLSQWAVEDRSSALLMELFYTGLAQGETKGAAIRNAQLSFFPGHGARGGQISEIYTHPYYWAPFFLVGDSGQF